MGCCFSTGKSINGADSTKCQTKNRDDRDPPPSLPLVEEETVVKEVLVHSVSSAPPISKHPQPEPELEPKPEPEPEPERQTSKANNPVQDLKPQIRREIDEKTPEPSQASEICSFSTTATTATTATTTMTEKRGGEDDDEAVSKPQRRGARSPGAAARGRMRPYGGASGRERVSRSPARKTEESPQGKRVGPRLVQARVTGQVGPARRNVGPPPSSTAVRRGESPQKGSVSRRSRSPATRTAGASSREVPVKTKGITGDNRSTEASTVRTEDTNGVKKEEESETAGTETIDNPLVSLECFIFL